MTIHVFEVADGQYKFSEKTKDLIFESNLTGKTSLIMRGYFDSYHAIKDYIEHPGQQILRQWVEADAQVEKAEAEVTTYRKTSV